MIRLVTVLVLLGTAAHADITDGTWEDSAKIRRTIENCLKQANRPETCIGQATEACRDLDIGAANPIQQKGWCSGAEEIVWQDMMDADIAEMKSLLTQGPTLDDFMAQQAAWETYLGNQFPYDRADATFPYRFWGDASRLPLVAMRALQVDDILGIVKECFNPDSMIPLAPLCKEINTTP